MYSSFELKETEKPNSSFFFKGRTPDIDENVDVFKEEENFQ